MSNEINQMLQERGKEYGNFADQASCSQRIKNQFRNTPNWNFPSMPLYQKESLEMIALKIARILHGNPFNADSWRDIAGYAKLVANELEKGENNANGA